MASSAASKMRTATADFVASSTSSLAHRRPLMCSSSRLVPQPPDLIRWVRREGGFVHPNLKIDTDRATSPGLGLVSTEPIPNGSDLIALPNHLPLRFPFPSSDSESALLPLASRIPEELWAMRLGLKLLQERAKVGSFWWSYVSNLPEAFSIPIFFSGEDIKNLQYAPLIYQVNKRCRFLLDFEKEIKLVLENVAPKDHPFGGQDVNASSLGWAMSAVSSRAFRLHGEICPDGKQNDVPMMLPLIDMCNHSFHPNARIVQVQEKSSSGMLVKAIGLLGYVASFCSTYRCHALGLIRTHGWLFFGPEPLKSHKIFPKCNKFQVVAETQIEQDTPITLNYGCLSNDLFLLDYGFVIPSSPFDYVELKYDGTLLDAASMAAGVSSPNFSSPAKWQQEILSQLNLIGDGALLKVNLGGPGLVDCRLLAALRVLLSSDKEEVQNRGLDALMSLSEEAPLGLSTETAALRTVIALCVVALEHFPTKIMQDESILKGHISSSMELAVQFRIEKKMMIIDVMRKITQRVKMLLSKEKAAA